MWKAHKAQSWLQIFPLEFLIYGPSKSNGQREFLNINKVLYLAPNSIAKHGVGNIGIIVLWGFIFVLEPNPRKIRLII